MMFMSKKFSISEVPQADELAKVLLTAEAVYNDCETDYQIAEYVGFTDRQGRYYRAAGELLGLITNSSNIAKLTSLGQEIIVLEEDNRILRIRKLLLENHFFKSVIGFIKSKISDTNIGVSRSELAQFLLNNVEGAESTINRRVNTVINWLTYTSLVVTDFRELEINEKETVFVYNYLADDEVNEFETSGSIYPANYSTHDELDIKENHSQVIGLIRKKDQGKILVPEFQRNRVWKLQQKSRFIESLILNIPVPPLYLSQDLDGNMIIIDGLQRTSAIFEFFDNSYSLVGLEALPKLNGLHFIDLENEIKARIEDREVLLYILKPTVPLGIVYDIFNRINSNGSPLTRQEIRNCIYIGRSTRLLASIAERPEYKKAINNGIPSLRMKDREAILRVFAFSIFDFSIDYKGDLDDFLGKTMRRINLLNESEIATLEQKFIRAMILSYDFFGLYNFRLPMEYGRGRVNIALMEVISVFFEKMTDTYLATNKEKIISNYFNVLLKDKLFIDSIRISTGSLSNVKTRFSKTFQILSNF